MRGGGGGLARRDCGSSNRARVSSLAGFLDGALSPSHSRERFMADCGLSSRGLSSRSRAAASAAAKAAAGGGAPLAIAEDADGVGGW